MLADRKKEKGNKMGNYLEAYKRQKKIIQLGGKDFTFSELSLVDLAEFKSRVVEERNRTREQRKNQLLEDVKKIEGLDPIKILERIDRPPTDDELYEEMQTIEGVGFLAYRSLKYEYPDMTEAEAMAMVTIDNLTELVEILVPSGEDESKKKRTRQPIKKK